MHQFGWLSERGGNFLNLLQKEGVPRKGGFPSEKGDSNPGGNCGMILDTASFCFRTEEGRCAFEEEQNEFLQRKI